jgi:CheY-like chemotaxis protein
MDIETGPKEAESAITRSDFKCRSSPLLNVLVDDGCDDEAIRRDSRRVDAAARVEALRAGYDLYLTKPVDAAELSAVVSRLGRRGRED